MKGVRRGAKLYVIDPRRTSSAAWADGWLGLEVGSDIALANAIGREILVAGLANETFIAQATAGFEAYRAGVEPYTLEYAERETGVPAALIRDLAHTYAKADRAMICWTLGITEHHNAVDNVVALINIPSESRSSVAYWKLALCIGTASHFCVTFGASVGGEPTGNTAVPAPSQTRI